MDEDHSTTPQQSDKSTLYAKMARVMGKLERLPKSGHNKHFNYHYATESDVADAIRKAMADEQIALLVDIAEFSREGKRTILKINFTFACGESGATATQTWYGEADDMQDKGINKAATSAEKYFLMKTFLISAGDMADDPDSGMDEDTPAQPKNKQKATPLKVTSKTATQPTTTTTADDDLTTQQRNTIKNTANDFNAWCKTQQFDSALVLKALKVSRLGEFDWLQEDALEVAKTAVHAYYADNQLGKTG